MFFLSSQMLGSIYLVKYMPETIISRNLKYIDVKKICLLKAMYMEFGDYYTCGKYNLPRPLGDLISKKA